MRQNFPELLEFSHGIHYGHTFDDIFLKMATEVIAAFVNNRATNSKFLVVLRDPGLTKLTKRLDSYFLTIGNILSSCL